MSFVLFADNTSAANTKILIDPGHGGIDSGASGNGLKEKDLTLDISKRINSILNANYEVSTKMTRSNDATVSLNQRTNIANQWGADLFLSIHINAGGGTGYEDYTHNSFIKAQTMNQNDVTSPEVQSAIHAEVKKVLDEYGERDRGKKTANFHVLRESGMAAILLEIMFIDTKSDAKLLRDAKFKQDMSAAISRGVANAYQLKPKGNSSKPAPSKPNKGISVTKMNKTFSVDATNLNVRSGNGTQYKSLGVLKNKATVKATGKTSNNWYKFSYKGKDAYVSGTYLKAKPSKPKPSKPAPSKPKPNNGINVSKMNKTFSVDATNLNVRSGNGTQYKSLGVLKNKATVKATGKTSNNWYKFSYKGKDAYVSGTYLKAKASKPKPSKPSNGKTYKVKSGDTLYSISVKNKVSVNNLKKWNNLKSNTISVNQKLKVSNKSTSKPNKPKPSKPKPNTGINVSKMNKTLSVDATSLNVRSGNGAQFKRLGALKNKATVKVTGKTSNNWYKFSYKGKDAYVSGKYLKSKPNSPTKKPSVNTNKTTGYKTTASLLNVRNKASVKNSKVVARLGNNTSIDVVKKINSHWYQIKYQGKNAYVSAKHVKKTSKASINQTKKYKTTATLLNVRNKASVNNSKVVARLAKNSTVDVVKKHNSSWYQIKYNGKNAYVSSKHIK